MKCAILPSQRQKLFRWISPAEYFQNWIKKKLIFFRAQSSMSFEKLQPNKFVKVKDMKFWVLKILFFSFLFDHSKLSTIFRRKKTSYKCFYMSFLVFMTKRGEKKNEKLCGTQNCFFQKNCILVYFEKIYVICRETSFL